MGEEGRTRFSQAERGGGGSQQDLSSFTLF